MTIFNSKFHVFRHVSHAPAIEGARVYGVMPDITRAVRSRSAAASAVRPIIKSALILLLAMT